MIKTPGSPVTPVTMRNLEKHHPVAFSNLVVVANPKLKVNLVVGVEKKNKPGYTTALVDYLKGENNTSEMESPENFTTQNMSPHILNQQVGQSERIT